MFTDGSQSLRVLRRSMTSFSSLAQFLLSFAVISGFEGATIERLAVPLAVRNGSGPVDLICVYNVRDDENGLVVKWYHNDEQIYMWMPPMEPQDLGVIAGFTSYTSDMTKRPETHSIIRLREVTLDMSGEYICSVSTFISQVAAQSWMTVYVPEKILDLQSSDHNETHMNISCSAIGAQPPPVLKISLDSRVLENPGVQNDYPVEARISLSKIIAKPTKAVLMKCEIRIPGTGYDNQEIDIYWPNRKERTNALRQTSSNSAPIHRADSALSAILISCYFTWICGSMSLEIATLPVVPT